VFGTPDEKLALVFDLLLEKGLEIKEGQEAFPIL